MNPDLKEIARLDTELNKAKLQLAELQAESEKLTKLFQAIGPDVQERGVKMMFEAWSNGVIDSIKVVKSRLAHYELYRCACDYHGPGDIHADWCPGKEMATRPATFATLEEILTLLEAMLERGQYKLTYEQL